MDLMSQARLTEVVDSIFHELANQRALGRAPFGAPEVPGPVQEPPLKTGTYHSSYNQLQLGSCSRICSHRFAMFSENCEALFHCANAGSAPRLACGLEDPCTTELIPRLSISGIGCVSICVLYRSFPIFAHIHIFTSVLCIGPDLRLKSRGWDLRLLRWL